MNALLVLGWRQKVQSRAKVRIAIEDTLDGGLPRAYTKELFAKKTEVLFEHLYEAYQGDGRVPTIPPSNTVVRADLEAKCAEYGGYTVEARAGELLLGSVVNLFAKH